MFQVESFSGRLVDFLASYRSEIVKLSIFAQFKKIAPPVIFDEMIQHSNFEFDRVDLFYVAPPLKPHILFHSYLARFT